MVPVSRDGRTHDLLEDVLWEANDWESTPGIIQRLGGTHEQAQEVIDLLMNCGMRLP